MKRTVLGIVWVLTSVAGAVAGPLPFTDGFEGPTLDPFWSTVTQSGSISLTNSVVHGGSQSAQFSSTSTGLDKHINLSHDFSTPMYGTVSVWFYDTGAGQPSSNYINLAISRTAPNFLVQMLTYDYGFAGGGPGRGDQYDYSVVSPDVNFVTATGIPRTLGWHQYTIQDTPQALTLFMDGTQVYTGTGGIPFDEVVFSLSGPSWRPSWVAYFDDFSFTPYNPNPVQDPANPVPEPATLVLLILGMAGAARYGGRRRS